MIPEEYNKIQSGDKLYYADNKTYTVESFTVDTTDKLQNYTMLAGHIRAYGKSSKSMYHLTEVYKTEEEAYLIILNNLQREAEDYWIKSKQYKKQ